MKLGSGIYLALPLSISKKAPTKKDFINIPLLKHEEKSKPNSVKVLENKVILPEKKSCDFKAKKNKEHMLERKLRVKKIQ